MTGERKRNWRIVWARYQLLLPPRRDPAASWPLRVDGFNDAARRFQISNNNESRVIRKLELETYLSPHTGAGAV